MILNFQNIKIINNLRLIFCDFYKTVIYKVITDYHIMLVSWLIGFNLNVKVTLIFGSTSSSVDQEISALHCKIGLKESSARMVPFSLPGFVFP